MANTTLGAAALNTAVNKKIVEACAGPVSGKSAEIKAFTATAGTGNYPIAGLTLDLSALFKNKILAVVVNPFHDPACAASDLAWTTVYVPASDGDPATGKLHVYAATGVLTANDAVVITGYVATGFAIGY